MKRIPLFERLQIESQSNCNRSCWFCPRTYDRSGKYLDERGKPALRRMPTEKILDLMDQARALGFGGPVGFFHYSEPLLDDRSIELAVEARKRGLVPELHTNGDVLLRNDALCEQVRRAYPTIVVGLYDYESDEELARHKQYWRRRLEGVELGFSPISASRAGSVYSLGIPRALVPPDARMRIPDLAFDNAPCHRPLIRLIVQYDGTVCHCCEDTLGVFDLGNVFESSIEAIWYSENHVRIIEDLIRGARSRYALCRNCPQPPSAPAPNHARTDITRRSFEQAALDTVCTIPGAARRGPSQKDARPAARG